MPRLITLTIKETRPRKNPLIIHYDSLNDLKEDAYINSSFLKLYYKFSPGPLTYILKKKKKNLNVRKLELKITLFLILMRYFYIIILINYIRMVIKDLNKNYKIV